MPRSSSHLVVKPFDKKIIDALSHYILYKCKTMIAAETRDDEIVHDADRTTVPGDCQAQD